MREDAETVADRSNQCDVFRRVAPVQHGCGVEYVHLGGRIRRRPSNVKVQFACRGVLDAYLQMLWRLGPVYSGSDILKRPDIKWTSLLIPYIESITELPQTIR